MCSVLEEIKLVPLRVRSISSGFARPLFKFVALVLAGMVVVVGWINGLSLL